jgi:hypothetical protein
MVSRRLQIPLRGLQVHERVLGRVLEARRKRTSPQHRGVQDRTGKPLRHLQGKKQH